VVIPALNEELTVGEFVDWCQEGFRRAGVRGEVLIIDSGTDRTTEIALAHGARVLSRPSEGSDGHTSTPSRSSGAPSW